LAVRVREVVNVRPRIGHDYEAYPAPKGWGRTLDQ
jgi:hypothetical protein